MKRSALAAILFFFTGFWLFADISIQISGQSKAVTLNETTLNNVRYVDMDEFSISLRLLANKIATIIASICTSTTSSLSFWKPRPTILLKLLPTI